VAHLSKAQMLMLSARNKVISKACRWHVLGADTLGDNACPHKTTTDRAEGRSGHHVTHLEEPGAGRSKTMELGGSTLPAIRILANKNELVTYFLSKLDNKVLFL
jgi:hypothetical protein